MTRLLLAMLMLATCHLVPTQFLAAQRLDNANGNFGPSFSVTLLTPVKNEERETYNFFASGRFLNIAAPVVVELKLRSYAKGIKNPTEKDIQNEGAVILYNDSFPKSANWGEAEQGILREGQANYFFGGVTAKYLPNERIYEMKVTFKAANSDLQTIHVYNFTPNEKITEWSSNFVDMVSEKCAKMVAAGSAKQFTLGQL